MTNGRGGNPWVRTIGKGIVIVLVASCIVQPPIASSATWTSHGPEGAYSVVLAIAPNDASTAYAATRRGVYKTTNAGSTWVLLPGSPDLQVPTALLVDPDNSSRVYVGSFNGFFSSDDAGLTWRAPAALPVVWTIVKHPTDSNRLFVGAGGAIYQSADQGSTWSVLNSDFTFVTGIAIDPSAPSTMYAAASPSGLYKSVDGGTTWSPARTGMTSTPSYNVLVDPTNPNMLYAITSAGLFKSVNGALTWSNASSGLCSGSPNVNLNDHTAVMDPQNPATLYVACYAGGISKTTDGAATWTTATAGIPFPQNSFDAIALAPSAPAILYVAPVGGSVFKTVNGASSWTPAGNGIDSAFVFALAGDSLSGAVYAGTAGNGVWKTIDGGLTWLPASSGLESYLVRSLATASAPDVIYAGTENGLHKSIDGGNAWVDVGGPFANTRIWEIATAPAAGDIIYVSASNGLYRSMDGGISWSATGAGLPGAGAGAEGISINAANPTVVFAGIGYVYRTTDGGMTWSLSSNGLPAGNFIPRVDPANSSRVYAVKTSGAPAVFVSTDGGSSWEPTAGGLVGAFSEDLQVDSAGNVYVGVSFPSRVYRSTDEGASWSLVATGGTTGQNITSVLVDPADLNRSYAGTTALGAMVALSAECGNGIIESPEECDDGNTSSSDCCSSGCEVESATTVCRAASDACDAPETCDGVTTVCPDDALMPAGTECRAAADACDVPESCTGTSGACPSDAHQPDGDTDGTCDAEDNCPHAANFGQVDGDGDGLGDACDACANPGNLTAINGRLRFIRLHAPAGNEGMTFVGEAVLPGAAIDPVETGIRLVVSNAALEPVVDATLPAGAPWRFADGAWSYKENPPVVAGIRKIRIRDLTAKQPGLYRFKFVGAPGTYPVTASGLPLRATVVLGPAAGQCGDVGYDVAECRAKSAEGLGTVSVSCRN